MTTVLIDTPPEGHAEPGGRPPPVFLVWRAPNPPATIDDAAAPRRVRLSRARGFRLPPGARSVARPAAWGNPCRLDTYGVPRMPDGAAIVLDHVAALVGPRRLEAADTVRRQMLVAGFRHWIDTHEHRAPILAALRGDLGGRDLACWCPLDAPCHADVLLELANR